MANEKNLNEKDLEQVAGGNSWNEYWGEDWSYLAPPRDTMDHTRENPDGRIVHVMGTNNVIDEYAHKDKRVK